MPKITKMEMGTTAAYLKTNCDKYGIKPPKEGVAKAVLAECYGKLMKAMKKAGVALGGECEHCDAESPETEEFCPWCAESLTAPAAPKDTSLTTSGGDCLKLTVPLADIESRLRTAVKDFKNNGWIIGDLLKRVRDSEAYKPARWDEWCSKFGISTATASNMINVVEVYPDPKTMPDQPLDKLYLFASVPEADRPAIEAAAATASRNELKALASEAKAKAHPKHSAAGKGKGKGKKVHTPEVVDEPVVRKNGNSKKVETAPESPLFMAKIGDKLTAPFVDSDGKKCQLAEAAKKKATATLVLGRNLRIVITISGDKVHGEIAK